MMNRIKDAFDLIRRTPAGRQALEAHELEITTDREDHVAAIEEAQTKLHDALPKLNDAVAEAQKQWDRARKAANAAEATHRSARSALNNAVHRAGHARDTHQLELAKGGDQRIPDVVRKLTALCMKEATGGLITEYEKTGRYNQLTGDALMRVSNNRNSRLRRMAAMRDAIKTISDLRFHAKADVSEEMRGILEGIPSATDLEFAFEGYRKELGGRYTVDFYLPLDVGRDFAGVLEPASLASYEPHEDGGTGGGIDIATVRPMA